MRGGGREGREGREGGREKREGGREGKEGGREGGRKRENEVVRVRKKGEDKSKEATLGLLSY